METPSLQYNALFQPFSRNPATVSGTYLSTCVLPERKSSLVVLAKLFSLSSPDVSLAEDFMQVPDSGERNISHPQTLSHCWNCSPTSTDIFGSSFGFVFRAWLLLQLELQKYHMHRVKKTQHLVLSVSCHKSDLLPALTFFPSSSSALCAPFLAQGMKSGKPSLGIHPQPLGSQDHPAAACFPGCEAGISHQ